MYHELRKRGTSLPNTAIVTIFRNVQARLRGRTSLLRKLLIAAAGILALGFVAFWIITAPATVPASALPPRTPDLANGKVMFYAGGCASCHASTGQRTPRGWVAEPALESPFGTFYAPNISPDRDDGIGRWNEADFVTALWKGTSPEGQHYYPAFPYTSYQRIALDDARDLFAYFKRCPPSPAKRRHIRCRFRSSWRRLLGGWKFLFLDGQPFRPDPSKSAQWNRGAYLVNGPGHCAECHSPRNVLGRDRGRQALCRRAGYRGQGLGSQHHPEGTCRLFREGHRLPARDRADAGRGLGWRTP